MTASLTTWREKKMPRYCKICGQTRSNGKFIGQMYMCIDCTKLPMVERHEKELITRINDLITPLNPMQKQWLESLKDDPRAAVRDTAHEACGRLM